MMAENALHFGNSLDIAVNGRMVCYNYTRKEKRYENTYC